MRKIYYILAIGAALPLLAACSPDKLDAKIQAQLPKICTAATASDAAFRSIAETPGIEISAKAISIEATAFAQLQNICASPENATAPEIVVAAATAYAEIAQQLHSATVAKAKATE